ncbi:MAG TPA: DUF1080 domain-containing protein [bacterium]|nr:DUF1080 domain-containing protein [bacterium]
MKSRHLLIIAALLIAGAGIFFILRSPPDETEETLSGRPQDPVGFEAPPDSPGWRPLFNGQDLTGWSVTNFGPQGPVRVNNQAIILGFGDGCTGITWQRDFPTGDYEISLDAMRVAGNDFFCGLTFPVQDEFCSFIVGGWGGTVVGISSIDGKDASENFTSTTRSFERQRWYHIRVRVTDRQLQTWIDGEQMVEVPVEQHQFSVRPEVRLSRPLGICAWRTSAALKNIRFRMLD